MKDPPFHHFPVFSVIDDNDQVELKYAQCTNCGIIHKVFDLCRSEILHGKEALQTLPRLDEIKLALSPEIRALLETQGVDITVYEQLVFIMDNRQWNEIVVLSTEFEGTTRTVKYLQVLGENRVRVQSTTLKEGF